MSEIQTDISSALDLNCELYDLVPDIEHSRLQKWEADLTNDRYTFEEEMEDYLSTEEADVSGRRVANGGPRTVEQETIVTRSANELSPNIEQMSPDQTPSHRLNTLDVLSSASETRIQGETHVNLAQNRPFDAWIDDLVEFKETVHEGSRRDISLADALYRLEASKDIPSVKLCTFDGNPLRYVDFFDTFKIHVHDKHNLSDDIRLVQLKMHVTGEASKAISGLGSGGLMYSTALKILKGQFGHQSLIARAAISKLTKGDKLMSQDRQGLRDLSLDVVNCIATLQRMSFFADCNTMESLRQIVMRFPDYLIFKWKTTVTDIRDRGQGPKLQHIDEFLRKQVRSSFDPDFGDIDTGYRPAWKGKGQGKDRRSVVNAAQGSSYEGKRTLKCYFCNEQHRVTDCPTFTDSTVSERLALATEHKLCFGCLVRGHASRECRSEKTCGKNGCTKMHHSLLHVDHPTTSAATSPFDKDGILPVLRARFRSYNGRVREGNVLIDSGAGTTIIRKEFAKSLGLQGKREGLRLSVVGGESLDQKDSRRVKFWISSVQGGEEFELEAHEIDKTVISVPALDKPWLASFPHLSDVELTQKSGPIDLILGVQYSHLHAEEESRCGLPFEPVGKRTKLGWYVIGAGNTTMSTFCSLNFASKVDMKTFYELETLGVQAPDCHCPKRIMSPGDKKAMEIFESSCVKKGNRYMIALPWKKSPSCLPNNYPVAEKRLLSLERSLKRNPDKAEKYSRAVEQYLENNWAVPLTAEEFREDTKPVYYLPHHGVHRPDKPSTHLRVVFDPACSYKGVSLNSLLHKCPCLIGNLLGVLLRFREENTAFVGDISKMFLQILLTEEDSQLHRFLWRWLDTSIPPKVYRLTRVTFDDKPSPDMASFVMLKLAERFKIQFPDAANIIERDRYVDDLIHSCKTPTEAVKRMAQLDEILADGNFKIKEWFCSTPEGKAALPEQTTMPESNQQSNPSEDVTFGKDDNMKPLGVCWNSSKDTIYFQVKDFASERLTKRIVLSKLSMLYDPLGLASVVTIRARVAMQAIWRLKNVDWDDTLPDNLQEFWRYLFQDMKKLEAIQFPRCLKPGKTTGPSELHVFADTSALAYGSVAYLLWPTESGSSIRLVSAKARVAPLGQSTIPGLELMAALIASRLAKTIVEELREKPAVTLWTDSQIVLHWIRSESIAMKAFVGVRIAEIQSTWDESYWKFVPTNENPADDLTRGIHPDAVGGPWMNGPEFLGRPKTDWPEQLPRQVSVDDVEQKRPKPICSSVKITMPIDVCRFSSCQRLVRVTALCFVFIRRLKSRIAKVGDETDTYLQPDDIRKAEVYWIRTIQEELCEWEERYKDLAPFVVDEIIRVGGRLRRSTLPYEQVHPVLLPPSNAVSKLIMRDIHNSIGHPGSERTLSETRRKYWIVKGRGLAKAIVRKCVVCRKLRQPPHVTLMGDLPPERLKAFSPPFTTTGVDLFGPFNLKFGRNRTAKAWGALFTRATIRAIHLEIVDGLSTMAFLQALRRFVANHGWPTTIISDNGTSFVGAQEELGKLLKEGKKPIQDFATLHKVKWIFITPLSPHLGGFYESLIKQTKRALKTAVGQQTLTWNEMSTVFAEAKCLVNSRPLGYKSNDPNDLQPITPNHFILGRASIEVPQGPFEESRNLHKRFEFVQGLANNFWRRFIGEYFPTLSRRTKWAQKGRQLQVGDIVLLTDSNVARGKWNLARIIEVFPGQDGVVRNIKVKTKSVEYTRSVQRCCPVLELDISA